MGFREIREVAVAILRVTLSCPFLEDDFHGGASIFAQHLVHRRRRSRAECYSSLAEAPRSDDQEKQRADIRARCSVSDQTILAGPPEGGHLRTI